MTPDPGLASQADRIVTEARMAREQLHQLIERMQHDRRAWTAALESFERHPRLTASQRTQFHRLMSAFHRRARA